MNDIREWLSGKKTYIVCLMGIIAAIAAWSQGELDNAKTAEAIFAAIMAATLRAGVQKSGPDGGNKTLPFLLAGLGLSVVLTGGCAWNGTQPLSNSQQYELASSSVRGISSTLRTAHADKLITDEDVVAIDPVMKQAFESLRKMRAEVLKGNPITVQWYLSEVQRLVLKITTMQNTAKEMNNGGGNSNGNSYRDERGDDPYPCPAAEAEWLAGGIQPGSPGLDRQDERGRRAVLERSGRWRQGPDRRQVVFAEVMSAATKEIEFD